MGFTKCGKRTKVVNVVDAYGPPRAVHLNSADRSEVKLIEPMLYKLEIPDEVSEHLIYAATADSDPLRHQLQDDRGIELVCLHHQEPQAKANARRPGLPAIQSRTRLSNSLDRVRTCFANAFMLVLT